MKYFILLGLCAMCLNEAQGQFTIASYNSSNVGLPSDYLGSVTIDRHNVVWIGGTEFADGDGGIFSFDGIEWTFTELEEDTSKPGINHIFDVQFGPHDDMWVYTYGQDCRITRVDSNSQTDFTPGDIFGSQGFSHDKSIWFIDWWTGLYEYNYDSLKWIFHDNLPVDVAWNPITTFNVDSTGIFWVGIGNKNIYRYKDTIISKIEIFPEYPPKFKEFYSINDVAFASDGSVWFATNEGLVHWFNDDEYIFYTTENSNFPSNDLRDVLIDQRGYVWCSFWQSGLGLLTEPGQDIVLYNEDNSGLEENEIRSMAKDKDGNIWLATWGGGVAKVYLSPSSVQSLKSSNLSLNIFPNPVKVNGELVILNEPSQDFVSMSIWSIEGILLKSFDLANSLEKNTFELTGMASGYYIAIGINAQGKKFASKFVVFK